MRFTISLESTLNYETCKKAHNFIKYVDGFLFFAVDKIGPSLQIFFKHLSSLKFFYKLIKPNFRSRDGHLYL